MVKIKQFLVVSTMVVKIKQFLMVSTMLFKISFWWLKYSSFWWLVLCCLK